MTSNGIKSRKVEHFLATKDAKMCYREEFTLGSFEGCNVLVRDESMNEMIYEMQHILNCEYK